MDKKTSKRIDEAVHKIRMDIWNQSVAITEDVQREIETRLIQSIHDRWEYMDNLKKKKEE